MANRLALTLLCCLSATPALAQGTATYPAKPVRMLVPIAPGGSTDVVSRIVAQKLTERWHQQVIVDNRPGAGGNIGTEIVSRAAPDGYTLLVTSPGPIVVNQWLFSKLPFDSAKDLVPVAMLAPTFHVMSVNPSVPVKSVRELIDLARKQPGKLVLASGGIGVPSDLMGEMFKNLAKVDITTVQYKGGAPAMTDVVGGQATMIIGDMITAMPFASSGRVRMIAACTAKRIPRLPDLPTLYESGVPLDATAWIGVFAPARTPAATVSKVNADLRELLKIPDVQEKLVTDGTEFGANTPQSLVKFIAAETEKYRVAVKVSGRRLD